MKNYNFPIEQDGDGFFAFCPELQGCYSQGNTHEETFKKIRRGYALYFLLTREKWYNKSISQGHRPIIIFFGRQ